MPRRLTREEIIENVRRIKETETYKKTKIEARRVLQKHEDAAIRGQHITQADLDVRITPQPEHFR